MAGKKTDIKFDSRHEAALRQIAKDCGCTFGGEGSLPKLVEAIAQRDPTVLQALCGLAPAVPVPPPSQIAARITAFIEAKQPFAIRYLDAAHRAWGFTVRYAELKIRYKGEKSRTYLDCWCEEGAESGNTEIPELSHNWSLRLDEERYQGANIEAIEGDWKSRDFVSVAFELSGGLAWDYKANEDDIADSGPSYKRQITRRCSSTYWLLREFAPHILLHPESISITEPESLKEKLRFHLERSVERQHPLRILP